MFGATSKQLEKLFCGFNDDTIPSALFNILAEKKEQKLLNAFDPNKPELDEATADAVVDLFKYLCNPETMLEIAIGQGDKFDHEKAGQKEFPSFGNVIELQQMESNKQMALILTGDFECNLPDRWNYATKKIASFKKSSDFEQTIHHFFSSDNTTQDLLILQYVHDPKNFNHFMHIKPRKDEKKDNKEEENKENKEEEKKENEEEKKENKEVKQRLIVLLVHMKPPIFKDPFPLLFSRKWKFTYVDNLSSMESVQLKTLLSQRVSDVLAHDVSNNRLRNALRRAFARLQFPTHKNGGGDIQRLSTLFEGPIEIEECRKEIISKLGQLLGEKGIVSEPIARILNKKEIKNPGNVDTLSLGCSFFERYENIIDRLLVMACMNILSAFYENCYFQVNSFFFFFFKCIRKGVKSLRIMYTKKKKVFFNAVENNYKHLPKLFVEVVKDNSMITIPRLTEVMQRLVSIEPDLRAVSVQYEAMFPWSHVLHNCCHTKLTNIVSQYLAEKSNAIIHENEDEKKSENENVHEDEYEGKYENEGEYENENKYEYEYQHENTDNNQDENKVRLESHQKVLQCFNLLKVVMNGSESALKCLNICDVEHCQMYFMDVIAAKYNLKQQCKAEVIVDLCQDDTDIILELHRLLKDENESTRLSGSIRLLLKHFISFSPGLSLVLPFFCVKLLIAENKWSDIVRGLEAIEGAIPTIAQFAKDWYGDCKEYETILAMCRRVQMQILGAKHFERQIIDKMELSNVLFDVMSSSEDGWLNDERTIATILERVLKEGNLALDKRPHFVRDVLTTVKKLEKLDTPNKKTVYCSVITDIFHKAHDLTPGVQNVTDKIRLQILEELVQNQWDNETFALDTHEAVLLNRILERIYMDTPNFEYKGLNQDIANISNVKAKLFQCIDSILSITKTLKMSEMKDNQELDVMISQASQFLTHFDQSNKCYQRSLHIWFLKQFYIAKGMGWTQMLFTNETIREKYPIFVNPQMSDVFSKFKCLPSNRPSTDPFIGIYKDDYINFKERISSGNLDIQYSGNKKDLFHYIEVKEYLLQCNVLNSDVEQNFVKMLLSEELDPTASSLRLTYDSGTSDAFISRLCFHFLGTLQMMHRSYKFYFCIFKKTENPFRVLILNPEEYVNGYLPAMPENLLMNIIRVMKTGKRDGDTFTVRYCPNMHPFIISGCGHPTEKIICAADGCGKEIGDTTHASQNTGLKQLEIPKGYILDGSDEELSVGDSFWRYEANTQIRKITEVPCTLIRLLIHLALLIRNAAVPEGCKQLQKLLQKTDAAEVTKFLQKQAIGYFRLLGQITRLNDEILSVALHQLLNDLPQKFNQWYPNGLNGTDLTITYNFESKFETGQFNELNKCSKITVDEEKDLKEIISEIEETKAIREQYVPNLFLAIHKVSFDDLAQRFMTEPSLKSKHPLLYHVMCAKDELWSVKYLP
ncbi:hypothetical protein RFI_21203, partial [Reticulomyxa filosa]